MQETIKQEVPKEPPPQVSNTTPWTGNLLEMFGFTKKEAAPQPSSPNTDGQPVWANPQTLWGMYTPKPPQVDPIERVFQKVIHTESRGKHRDASGELLTSPAGAQGITQVMPKTGKNPGYGVAPLKDDSEQEYIRFGKDLLRAYTKEFGGDVRKGLAAYNHGIGAVQRSILKNGDNWESKLPKETKKYIQTILGS